ncbi:hypothetical protein BJX99DRAFT_220456 [Aspergillus californicus]
MLGATGYTEKLTAQHICKSLPPDLKWAIAGRNREKLEEVAPSLVPLNPSRKPTAMLAPSSLLFFYTVSS